MHFQLGLDVSFLIGDISASFCRAMFFLASRLSSYELPVGCGCRYYARRLRLDVTSTLYRLVIPFCVSEQRAGREIQVQGWLNLYRLRCFAAELGP